MVCGNTPFIVVDEIKLTRERGKICFVLKERIFCPALNSSARRKTQRKQ